MSSPPSGSHSQPLPVSAPALTGVFLWLSVAATLSLTTQCRRLPGTKDAPGKSRSGVVAPGNYRKGLGEAASLAQQLPSPHPAPGSLVLVLGALGARTRHSAASGTACRTEAGAAQQGCGGLHSALQSGPLRGCGIVSASSFLVLFRPLLLWLLPGLSPLFSIACACSWGLVCLLMGSRALWPLPTGAVSVRLLWRPPERTRLGRSWHLVPLDRGLGQAAWQVSDVPMTSPSPVLLESGAEPQTSWFCMSHSTATSS